MLKRRRRLLNRSAGHASRSGGIAALTSFAALSLGAKRASEQAASPDASVVPASGAALRTGERRDYAKHEDL